MPWQAALADVAYEYDPESGLFRYDEVDCTVPRQSGKTTITLAKKVHRLTVMARTLGPQRSTYTAQTRLKARNKLEKDFSELLRSSRSFGEVPNAKARPQKATEWRLSLNNGSESIQFGSGSFLQIDAPSRTGGHGDTLDDGTIDEAFAHADDTIEAGMRPSMATRKNSQLWVISTAGDARSFYLWRKVLAGRVAHESGEHGRTCYVEYSAHEDEDPGDPRTWWGCMPALGHTITEDFIRGEWERAQRKGPEGISTFLRAYLNLWPEIPTLAEDLQSGLVDLYVWAALAERIGTPVAPMLAVELAADRSAATIGAAWLAGGRPHVELVEDRPGVDWVVDRLVTLSGKYDAPTVALDGSSEAASLVPALEQAGVSVTVLNGSDRAAACGGFFDLASTAGLSHDGNPALAAALAAARWKDIGEGARMFSRRKSAGDIRALYAVTFALHVLQTTTQPREFWGAWA